jgi:hypothetical protein
MSKKALLFVLDIHRNILWSPEDLRIVLNALLIEDVLDKNVQKKFLV